MTNVSALEILSQAIKTYRVEIKVDSKAQQISIYESIGSDRGTYFYQSAQSEKARSPGNQL